MKNVSLLLSTEIENDLFEVKETLRPFMTFIQDDNKKAIERRVIVSNGSPGQCKQL